MRDSGSIQELHALIAPRPSLCVLDVGAGTLSMFNAPMPGLTKKTQRVHYIAVEMDAAS